MTHAESPETKAVLEKIYGIPNFYQVFFMAREMVEKYIFAYDANEELSLYDYVFGFESPRIAELYAEMGVYEGRELALKSTVETITNELSARFQDQNIGIWTGALNRVDSSKVRFVNSRNYANVIIKTYAGS